MTWDHLIGNEQIKHYLHQALTKNAIGNSLLFAGHHGVGKGLFAKAFAKEVLKTKSDRHPDLHIYRPEGKVGMHPISTMRSFNEEVNYAPYQGKRKVFIIEDADRMLSYSANALLKTFEEPSLDTLILLITDAPERLLPTILSRCRMLRFLPVDERTLTPYIQELGKNAEEAAQLAQESNGSVAQARKLALEGVCPMQQQIRQMLATGEYADYNVLLEGVKEITTHLEDLQKELEEEIRATYSEGFEEMNALQKEGLQKEVEGAVSLALSQKADNLFETILYWYRDLHLLQIGASQKLVRHQLELPTLIQILQNGNLPSLNDVERNIVDARTSLARSTSFSLTLENLFLNLVASE